MFVAGIVAAAIGIVLFHTALGSTLRANLNATIPFGRNPKVVPRGSVAMRAAGAGLIVLGAVLVSTGGWPWTMIVLLVGPVVSVVVLALHNWRVMRQKRSRAWATAPSSDGPSPTRGSSLRS